MESWSLGSWNPGLSLEVTSLMLAPGAEAKVSWGDTPWIYPIYVVLGIHDVLYMPKAVLRPVNTRIPIETEF